MRPRCPSRPTTEDGDGHLSPPRGPSQMLKQRATGLPSSSAAPKICPGTCRALGGHCTGPTQPRWPLPRSSCSFLATFVAILQEERWRWWGAAVTPRWDTQHPQTPPLHTRICFAGASTEELLQPLGPSPGGTGLAAASQPGDQLWAPASAGTHGPSPIPSPSPAPTLSPKSVPRRGCCCSHSVLWPSRRVPGRPW